MEPHYKQINTLIMRNIHLLKCRGMMAFLLFVTCITTAFSATITPEEALKIVKSEYYGGSNAKMNFYYANVFYFFSDFSIVSPVNNFHPDLKPNSYVFFVDEEPDRGWSHSCSYIYISDTGKKHERKKYNMPMKTDWELVPIEINFQREDLPSRKIRVQGTGSSNTLNVPSIFSSSGKVYSIIISGGASKHSNYERYWNDCSYIYQVLKKKYGMSDDDISVLISDGKDPSPDMMKSDGRIIVSSPQDLDFDGVDDIDYSATKANLDKVISDLSAKVTDKDQVFIYVIDHGGYDDVKGESFICLWNLEFLYASEFAGMLDSLKTPFINVVLGQCNSGGFVSHLEKPGRVIATACRESESSWACRDKPYDEFVYHWTSAINQQDGLSQSAVASDLNNNGCVSMYEAFLYARNNDRRIDRETPSFSSPNISVAEEMTLDNTPRTYSLYVRDGISDSGAEPSNCDEPWNSPDLWVRNQPDGYEHQESEPITIPDNATDKDVHVYMRIRNRGISDYADPSKKLFYHIYYVNASLGITPANWLGLPTPDDEYNFGAQMVSNLIPYDIEADGSRIVHYRWGLDEDMIRSVSDGFLRFCLLGRISNSRGEELIDRSLLFSYLSDVCASNKLCQKNLSFIKIDGNNPNYVRLKVRSMTNDEKPYNLELVASNGCERLFDKAEVSVTLSDQALSKWKESGMEGNGIKCIAANPNKIYMQNNSSIKSLLLKNTDEIKLACNFKSSASLKTDTFKVNLIQRDVATGKIVGGEAIYIIKESSTYVRPYINQVNDQDGNRLEAGGVDDDCSYEWYCGDDNLLGTKKILSVPDGFSGDVTLRAISGKDGTVGYAMATVEKAQKIKSVTPLPFKASLNIELLSPATKNTAVRLVPAAGTGEISEYPVKEGDSRISMSVPQLSPGLYVVSLVKDGSVIDIKRVTKE